MYQIPGNLGKSRKNDFKGHKVNKGRTELNNHKATIARVKENVHKRESSSARTRALRWFRAHNNNRNIYTKPKFKLRLERSHVDTSQPNRVHMLPMDLTRCELEPRRKEGKLRRFCHEVAFSVRPLRFFQIPKFLQIWENRSPRTPVARRA